MTCERCAELEEELALLRRDMGMSVLSTETDLLTRATKLRPGEAATLVALYRAKTPYVSNVRLLSASDVGRYKSDLRDLKLVDVYICRIRKRLGRDAIRTEWGRGYSLTDTGRALVSNILEPDTARAA